MPYGLLVVFVLMWGFKPIQALLNSVTVNFPWPLLHNQIQRMPPVVSKPSLYARALPGKLAVRCGNSLHVRDPGLCLVAAHVAARDFARLMLSVGRQLLLPTVTVTSVLSMAFVMNYCGATGHPGTGLCRIGRAVSFLQPAPRLAGRVPDRLRHFCQCALWKLAGFNRRPFGV